MRANGPGQTPWSETCANASEHPFGNYTIFEGTSEIQRLIIARAISGLHIQ
jgi:hypothetical protein